MRSSTYRVGKGADVNVESGSPNARRLARALLGFWAAFAVLMASSMSLYPGGTWLDRSAVGHHFFSNFFCDLTQPTSLSGVPNRAGSLCAQVGMVSFALALAVFFWLVPNQFQDRNRDALRGRAVRRLGAAAIAVFLVVTALPSELIGKVHAWLALTSGVLGIGAALLGVRGLLASTASARALGWLGVAALGVAAFDALLFAWTLNGATVWLVPAAQKVAAALLSAWMLSVARLELRRA